MSFSPFMKIHVFGKLEFFLYIVLQGSIGLRLKLDFKFKYRLVEISLNIFDVNSPGG